MCLEIVTLTFERGIKFTIGNQRVCNYRITQAIKAVNEVSTEQRLHTNMILHLPFSIISRHDEKVDAVVCVGGMGELSHSF